MLVVLLALVLVVLLALVLVVLPVPVRPCRQPGLNIPTQKRNLPHFALVQRPLLLPPPHLLHVVGLRGFAY